MIPEERKLVTDLFDRLGTLEDAPRDPDAERLIRDGLRQAPNAPYALVQTVLVQDEALKRANARIQELEKQLEGGAAETAPRDTSFLGGMRDTLLGRRESRSSVPSVQPGQSQSGQSQTMSPAWRNTGTPAEPAGGFGPGGGYPQGGGYPPGGGFGPPGYGPGYGSGPQGGGGGSFLGTAAAAAAGVIGGSLLMNSIRGLMGHQGGSAHAAFDPNAGGGGAG